MKKEALVTWKNGQFLTLVIILLQEYVWLAVNDEWVLDFLNFDENI